MNFVDNSGMEKRRYIRVPSHFPLKYYSVEDPAAESSPFESMSDNISVGGVMFFAQTKFRINEMLRIEFRISHIHMSIFGRVVWIDEIEKDTLYNTGVEFQNLSQQQKDDLGTFVKDSLDEKRKLK